MPFEGDPAVLLNGILADIGKIERFTLTVNRNFFEQNDEVAYAVKYALLRISEAAHRLGEMAPELAPEVPWRDLRGLGNRLRHAYDTIDDGLVWKFVERDVPALRVAVEAAIRKLGT